MANPMAMALTGALMLRSLGHEGPAGRLEGAVSAVLEEGPTTPDLGGRAGTTDVARALLEAVG